MAIKQIVIFVLALIFMIALESLWLGVIMKPFYTLHLKDFVRLIEGKYQVRWLAAIATWLLLVLGIFIFVKPDQLSIKEAALLGGLYGLVVYGVYDLTNYAMMPAWPRMIVFVDIAWGVVLNTLVSIIAAFLAKLF